MRIIEVNQTQYVHEAGWVEGKGALILAIPLLESGFTRTGCVDGGGFRGLTFLATRSFINMWQKRENKSKHTKYVFTSLTLLLWKYKAFTRRRR